VKKRDCGVEVRDKVERNRQVVRCGEGGEVGVARERRERMVRERFEQR
jgi:hypothetical protein